MKFLHPEMASWLLALPLAFGVWVLHVRAKRRFRHEASIGARLRALSRLSTSRRDAAALTCALVALGSLVLAAMRPQVFVEVRVPEFERKDLVLVLDRSISMRAEDVRPSRFGRAVREIKTFLTSKPDGIDRVGLVGFAGTSLILSHLTRDIDSLFFYLDWIEEDREPRFGTDIGAALASARELAKKDARATQKIFLVLSDGDDQGRDLPRVLRTLREEQTRVYCVGIGSEGEALIPVSDGQGAIAFVQDEEGRLLSTRFDETTLKSIATFTGGRYFRSTTGHELAAAMRGVVDRERRLLGWNASAEYRDIYHLALLAAAVAAFALLLTL